MIGEVKLLYKGKVRYSRPLHHPDVEEMRQVALTNPLYDLITIQQPCKVCDDHSEFAKAGRGLRHTLYAPKKHEVFICWECVHAMYKQFTVHILGFSYNLVDDELRKMEVSDG